MLSQRSSIIVVLLLLGTIVPASAQTPPAETPLPETAAAAAPVVPGARGRIQYGVRFGPSFTTLTSVETFDDTAEAATFEPTLNFGGFVTIGFGGALSFQPEVLFAAKGQRIRDKDAPPITTPTGETKPPPADRVILVRYLEFPLLLRVSKRTHENTSLYLIAGPAFAIRRNAVIREVADSGRLEDIEDQVNGTNFSFVGGGGLQHKRWLVDARFTRGMQNIATDPTPSAVKTGAFSVLMGARF